MREHITLETPHLSDSYEVLEAFQAGQVACIKSSELLIEDVRALNFDTLKNQHRDVPISGHTKFEDGVFKPTLSSTETFINKLEKFISLNRLPTASQRAYFYGVVNARRYFFKNVIYGPVADMHATQASYLWLGMSSGGLHYDALDNVLFQIQGVKQITVFPPQYADQISQKHYVALDNELDLFSVENKTKHPFLSEVPSYTIELHPGDAVVIPSAAYHSPKSLTFDSISVNSFLNPKAFGKNFRSRFARDEENTSWVNSNYHAIASRAEFLRTGVPSLKTGHYEII